MSVIEERHKSDEKKGLTTNLYDKRDYFNFPIVHSPFIYAATFQQHLHMEYICPFYFGHCVVCPSSIYIF